MKNGGRETGGWGPENKNYKITRSDAIYRVYLQKKENVKQEKRKEKKGIKVTVVREKY